MKHYDSVEVGKRIKDIRKKAGIFRNSNIKKWSSFFVSENIF